MEIFQLHSQREISHRSPISVWGPLQRSRLRQSGKSLSAIFWSKRDEHLESTSFLRTTQPFEMCSYRLQDNISMMNVANVPCWEFLLQVFMFSFSRYVPKGECQSKIVIFLFLFYLVESSPGGERKCTHLFCKLYPQIVTRARAHHTLHRKRKKKKMEGRIILCPQTLNMSI